MRFPYFDISLRAALASLLALHGAAHAGDADGLGSTAELKAGKARAEAELVADRIACEQFAGNRRDVCRERASGKERVARAELELAHAGTRQARDRLASVRLDVAFDIERTMCNDRSFSDRNICAQNAQAARTQGEALLKAR